MNIVKHSGVMTSFWIGVWEVPNSNLGQETYKTEKVCVVYCSNSIHLPWQYVDQATMRLPSIHFAIRYSANILPWTRYRLRYRDTRETEVSRDTWNWGTERYLKLRYWETRETEVLRDTWNWGIERHVKLRYWETRETEVLRDTWNWGLRDTWNKL